MQVSLIKHLNFSSKDKTNSNSNCIINDKVLRESWVFSWSLEKKEYYFLKMEL